jgi:zinc protease
MVQVVVGDVDADEVVERASEQLGRLEGRGRFAGDGRREAELPEWTPGAVVERGVLRQPYLAVGFRTPPVRDPDVPVLDVLCGLLGEGRSSRLRKIVQTGEGLASDVGASVVAHRDVGILTVRAVGTTGAEPREIVASLFREIWRLADTSVTAEEMRKSVRRLEAAYLLEHETVETIAMTLGFFETMGDHGYAEEYVDRLAEVTPDDIQRVARTYLDPTTAAVVAYVPEGGGAPHASVPKERSSASDELLAAALQGARTPSAGAAREVAGRWRSSERFARPQIAREKPPGASSRRKLPNGATLVVRESSYMPLVSVAMAFRGGFVDEPDSALGITGLTLKHMLRGTPTRSAGQLADDIEGLGSGISTSVDRDGFGVGSSVLSKHLEEALLTICEVVSRPAFGRDEFEGARGEALADVGEVEDHPFQRAMLRLVPWLFPGHPYGRPIVGTVETLSAMTPDCTGDWHTKSFATDNLFVCMAGDVSTDAAAELLERALEGFEQSAAPAREPSEPGPPGGRVDERLDRSGQSSIAVGFRGPRIGTRDSAAMHVACASVTMMGGRLWGALRERPPFAYSVRAMPVPFRESGAVVGYATTPPGQEEEAVETFTSVLFGLGKTGLSPEELERGKRYLAGMLEISMQRGAARAASYAMAEVAGIGYEHVDRLPGLVRSITNDDVVRVAGEYLTAEDGPAVAILRG